MSFDIANDSLQETAFILAVVGVTLAILATGLRFVATACSSRKPSWDDWFAVLATFFFILYVVPFLYLLRVMNGRSLGTLPAADIVKMTKAGYAMSAQFCMQQLFAKWSLLFLYYRLFHPHRLVTRCIYFLAIVQLLWSIGTYLAHWLVCTPPAKLWNPKLPGQCINEPILLAVGETINSLVDFAMVIMAVYIVQSLQMKRSTKTALSVLFALGSLAGILGFVKIGQGFEPMSTQKADPEKVELLDPIWATVQQTCSIICCCAPIYRPLYAHLTIFQKLRSLGSRVLGKSHLSDGSVTDKADMSDVSERNAPSPSVELEDSAKVRHELDV